MLDTNYSNDVAQHLIENKLIPGWEEWRVVRREYTVKLHGTSSRFDLLLTNDKGDEFLLEVKSCTLFSKIGAMFPDAITERGRKHLLHLKELQNEVTTQVFYSSYNGIEHSGSCQTIIQIWSLPKPLKR